MTGIGGGIRFLQFSDTHLRADTPVIRGIDNHEAFQRAIEIANHGARFVIHTGDLVSRPADDESYGLYAEMLRSLLPPVRHLPGNHDDSEIMRRWIPDTDCTYPWVFEEAGLRFIGLDSSTGSIDRDQLERLSALLRAEAPCMIFLHHHLTAIEESWLNPYRLENTDEFKKSVREAVSPVLGIAHGHAHHFGRFVFAGVPVFSGPALAAQFDPYGEFQDITNDEAACTEFTISSRLEISCRLLRCGGRHNRPTW